MALFKSSFGSLVSICYMAYTEVSIHSCMVKQLLERKIVTNYKTSKLLLVTDLLYIDKNVVFKDFVYLFLERGEGKEKERERNTDV